MLWAPFPENGSKVCFLDNNSVVAAVATAAKKQRPMGDAEPDDLGDKEMHGYQGFRQTLESVIPALADMTRKTQTLVI